MGNFGHWLSGFVDGEGWFSLRTHMRKKPLANGSTVSYIEWVLEFGIGLRADDEAILDRICKYLKCGKVISRTIGKKDGFDRKPQVCLSIKNKEDLPKIVRHFERYPLRSKKKKQFEIWKNAVEIVTDRTRRIDGKYYTEEDIASLLLLHLQLKEERKYNHG